MFENYKDIVGVKELREMLGVGRDKAYSLIISGAIEAFQIGNMFRIPKRNVISYIEKSLKK